MEERDKYKNLHLLIDRVSARLSKTEEENSSLRAQLRATQNVIRNYDQMQASVRELREWKDAATSVLKKLSQKVKREIEKIEDQSARPNI